MNISRGYLLGGVFPLFVVAIIFIFLGSYNIERSTDDLNNRIKEYREAAAQNTTDEHMEEIVMSLNKAKYNRSVYIFMMVCAGIMIVHALVLFELKDKWTSSFATILGTLVVFGALRKYNSIGTRGFNNLMIYLGCASAFVMAVITARNSIKGFGRAPLTDQFEN